MYPRRNTGSVLGMKKYLIEYVWKPNRFQSRICKIVARAWSEEHARVIFEAQKILSVKELNDE